MFIRVVDDGLEKLLRATLPMPEGVGDITFDAPSSSWAAQLSRVTVNLFLYDVALSDQVSRAPIRRGGEDGARIERRGFQPMVKLTYLVSTWAGSPRDEHELLGDVLSRLAGQAGIPAEHLPTALASTVSLRLVADANNKPRDVWSAAGGALKPSFFLEATAAADTFGWQQAAPTVTRIESFAQPRPDPAAARPGS